MARVSSIELSEKDRCEFEKNFYSFITSFKNAEEISSFLKHFLTDEEQIMLSKRLKLLQLSSQDYSPEEIKEALQVSYESARSYKLLFEYKPEFFKQKIAQSLKTQDKNHYKDNTFLNALDIIVKSRSSAKARAKLYQGDFKK